MTMKTSLTWFGRADAEVVTVRLWGEPSEYEQAWGVVQAVILDSFAGLCSSLVRSIQLGRVWSPVINWAPRS